MNIFESLENLNVSEECFNDIMGIVEELLSEGSNLVKAVDRAYDKGRINLSKNIELREKAYKIPSSDDYHYNDNGELDTSNVKGKSLPKTDRGEYETDKRHIKSGRSTDELTAKRRNDEKNNYLQATAKAVRKHKK